ncbi:MAG: 4Fe-4S binding protein [Aristaeellaceae bacterium]
MADLSVKALGLINPFIVASSPATQGAKNVLKSARMRPGALVMRNFGHGSGGGSCFGPGAKAAYAGQPCFHSHAVGRQIPDRIATLEQYCEEVRAARKALDSDIRLWVSIGHYSDIVRGGDWEKDWIQQARELKLAGADALELHFNTPGVAVARDRTLDYYGLVRHCTGMIKQAAGDTKVMVKLAVESCDVLTSMRIAQAAGADAVGPTARWKAFCMDLDWRRTQPRPGAGYGGTQATPIVCYAVAEGRCNGITLPMYAGGGVFSYDQAARLIMAGSDCVQLGAMACSGGTMACRQLIEDFAQWMDRAGYPDMDSLKGDALQLFSMPADFARARQDALGDAYQSAQVDPARCVGCGRCQDVCWHEGIELRDRKACKTSGCIGCGYCFQVCPTGALHVEAGDILARPFRQE